MADEEESPKPTITIDVVVSALLSRAEKYGIATVLLFMLIYWAKPHVDEMIRSHGKLLENTQAIQVQQATTLVSINEVQIKQAQTMETATKTLERVDRNAADTNTTVHELKAKGQQ